MITYVPSLLMTAVSPAPGTTFGSQFWGMLQLPPIVFVQVKVAALAVQPAIARTSKLEKPRMIRMHFICWCSHCNALNAIFYPRGSEQEPEDSLVSILLKGAHFLGLQTPKGTHGPVSKK